MELDKDYSEIRDEFEISLKFRRMILDRIARLESDAASDEAMIWRLENSDHIRRQTRLVLVQREEAARMRSFLDRSKTRSPKPIEMV